VSLNVALGGGYAFGQTTAPKKPAGPTVTAAKGM